MILMAAIVILVFVPFSSDNSDNQDFQVATVERGDVILSYQGEGVVEPQSEVLILSPASSIIKEILKEVGAHVDAGEPIIILDPTPIQSEIENIQDQLEMKQNSLRKNYLNARSTKVDLEYQVQVKNLRIASLKSELTDQEQLLEVGGISPARYEKTKQELELAESDLRMLKEKNTIKLEQLEADEEGLKLQITMQEKVLAAKEEALSKMIIRAPSAGILLSIHGKVGEKVNHDRLLVEMSDLTNFKVQGMVDDDHYDYLKTGTRVYVLVDNERLEGRIGTIDPVAKDRKIEFDVTLKQSSHPKLRPNRTVSMDIVRAARDSVLRLPQGPVFVRGREHEVVVIGPAGPERRLVKTGLKTEDFVHIREGLEEGEKVVLTHVSSLEDLESYEGYEKALKKEVASED